MLRIITLVLLTANLLVFGFHAVSAPVPAKKVHRPILQAPAHLPPIQLFDELDDSGVDTNEYLKCYSVGPFETEDSRERIEALLQDVTIEATQRESRALVELGYWVSLPPYDSFQAAAEDMRELGKLGLKDTAVMTDRNGEWRLSLGYFLEEANARQRRNQARELGFDADTQLQREPQSRFWIDYQQIPGTTNPGLILARQIEPGQLRSIPCRSLTDSSASGPIGI